jgi:hypothetical protein
VRKRLQAANRAGKRASAWVTALVAACGLALGAGALSALPACSDILHLDPGVPSEDASIDSSVPIPLPDASLSSSGDSASVTTEAAAPLVDTGAAATDGAPPADASGGDGDACTPDPAWCDSHCGTGPDNCGESRQCATDCQTGYVCGTGNTCECETEVTWCAGRCGSTTDNCGRPLDCGPLRRRRVRRRAGRRGLRRPAVRADHQQLRPGGELRLAGPRALLEPGQRHLPRRRRLLRAQQLRGVR